MKHVGIEIKFYNLNTFIKQIDVNFIDLDSKLVDLNSTSSPGRFSLALGKAPWGRGWI